MKVKSFFPMLLMATLSFCWTACSDSDNNDDNVENNDNIVGHEMTPEQINDFAAENFIAHVCEVEKDTATFKLKSWDLNYGRVLYPNTPNVRYTRAVSQEDARQEFLSMICYVAVVDSSSHSGVITVDMGSHGTVKYTPVNENGEWARVEVNLKELPTLQTIVYCKPEAWPENAGDCGVKKHTVYSRQEGGLTVYYICVKECSIDGTGYLIGFDTWTINDSSPAHSYGGKSCYDAWWNRLTGGKKVIEYLRGFLYYSDGRKYEKAETIIRTIGEKQKGNSRNESLCGKDALYNFLYSAGNLEGRNPFFKTGDEDLYIDSPSNRNGTYHFPRPPYTKMTPKSVDCTVLIYNCYDLDPHTHNKENQGVRDGWSDKNGNSWALSQFGTEWIWKVNEWYSFQRPYIIEFHDTDATNLADFRSRYGLSQVNL